MFVGHISEDGRGMRKVCDRGKNGYEGRIPNELFRHMNHDREEPPSTRDLVFLYKNIDLGNNPVSNYKEVSKKVPNQRVETVVYEECDSDSDLSEIYSNEDLHNILIVNNERIDQLDQGINKISPSKLCHKFRDLEIHPSNVKLDSVDTFSLRNNMIPWKLPLTTYQDYSSTKYYDSPLSDSLNEYMQCKRLQGNYNISMDNVIQYVNHTIGQLKRISNGDYLTEKAKEKWKESDCVDTKIERNKALEQNKVCKALEQNKVCKALEQNKVCKALEQNKVCRALERNQVSKTLVTTNNVLKSKQNITKNKDFIQSEVDIEMINKNAKNNIQIQVTQPLKDTLKLLNVYRPDNLVITCKTVEKNVVNKDTKSEQHINVTLQLNQPKTAYIVNSISATTTAQIPGCFTLIPLPYKGDNDPISDNNVKAITNTESPEKESGIIVQDYDFMELVEDDNTADENENLAIWTCEEGKDDKTGGINVEPVVEENESVIGSDEKAAVPSIAPDLQDIMESALPKANTEDIPSLNTTGPKPKSRPLKTKSPYENKSYIIDEKKRKRLLEIKQKREKLKQSMAENLKVNKSQFSRVNSITKLSISNKSFYDSIFGQSVNGNLDEDPKLKRLDKAIELPKSEDSSTYSGSIKDEEAQREFMMHLDIKHKHKPEPNCSSGDPNKKSPVTIQKIPLSTISDDVASSGSTKRYEKKNSSKSLEASPQLIELRNPTNTPKTAEKVLNKAQSTEDDKKSNPSVEFRKSIDKIYELINKRPKTQVHENRCKSKFTAVASAACKPKPGGVVPREAMATPATSHTPVTSHTPETLPILDGSVHCTDSGNSLKHRLATSNISFCNSDKTNKTNSPAEIAKSKNANKAPNVDTKVITSTKSQSQKSTEGSNKNDHRKVSVNTQNTPNNPLKAISQLLHEFDNVQKSRKLLLAKSSKRHDHTVSDIENEKLKSNKKYHQADAREVTEKPGISKSYLVRVKTPISSSLSKQKVAEEKSIIRKINTDVTDEILEARGEAVRGPSIKQSVRFNSKKVPEEDGLETKEIAAFRMNARLNSLAQPKKSYIKALDEDFPTRYGRNVATNRLQRLNASGSSLPTRGRFPSLPNRSFAGSTSSPDKLQKKPPDEGKDRLQKKLPDEPLRKNKIKLEVNLLKPNVETELSSDPSSLKSQDLQDSTEGSVSNNEICAMDTMPVLDLEVDSQISTTIEDDRSILKNRIYQTSSNVVTAHPDTVLNSWSLSINPPFQSFGEVENPAVCSDVIPVSGYGDSTAESITTVSEVDKQVDTDESESNQDNQICMKKYNSVTAPKTIENAVYATVSVNSFKKIFTVQNISYLQSGDSHVLNSKKTIKQHLEELIRLECPVIRFPIKITTVGYAFPEYDGEVSQSKLPELRPSSSLPGIIAEPLTTTSVSEVPLNIINLVTQMLHIDSSIRNGQKLVLPTIEESELQKVNEILPAANTNEERQDDNSSSTDNSVVTFISRVKSNLVVREDTIQKQCNDEFAKTNDDNKKINKEELKCDEVDNTNSLDVLVKLLNEIQNITCSQSQIATPDIESSGISIVDAESHDIISLTSLEKLRQLESRTSSLFSFCVSETSGDVGDENIFDERVLNRNFLPLTPYVNKRVEVGIQVKELLPKWSEAPLILFPSKRNHATHVTNSLIGILSERSSTSSIDIESNKTFTVPDKDLISSMSQHLAIQPYKCSGNTRIAVGSSDIDIQDINQKPVKLTELSVIETKATIANTKRLSKKCSERFSENRKKIKAKDEKISIDEYENNKHIAEMSINKYSADPIISFKRDILVTLYSVLVFTVFAALSIPDFLYRL